MRVANRTRGTSLGDRVRMASSLLSTVRGLMLAPPLCEGEGLVLDVGREKRLVIWMPLMRFPLDVVWADAGLSVVGLARDVPPLGLAPRTWRLFEPPRPARYAVELPVGAIERSRTRLGDRLAFEGSAGAGPVPPSDASAPQRPVVRQSASGTGI